jgi:hypothetical protein
MLWFSSRKRNKTTKITTALPENALDLVGKQVFGDNLSPIDVPKDRKTSRQQMLQRQAFVLFERMKSVLKSHPEKGPSPVAMRIYRYLDQGTTKLDTTEETNISSLTPKEVCPMSGLLMLIERYTIQVKELEARITELKRKLEIVMEVSRLLEEEGVADDNPQTPH